MDRSTVIWTLIAFFGASLLFAALNRLTADSSSAVSFAVQAGALAVLLLAALLVVRRFK
jgi:hypothetical protein